MPCSVPDCDRPIHARQWCMAHYSRWKRWGTPEGKNRRQDLAIGWVRSVAERAGELTCGEADWPFGARGFGYGEFQYEGRKVKAHRVVLSLVSGQSLDSELCALHSCDRPLCCNPDCLRWGTHAENSLDRSVRNRVAKGERVWTAKLDQSQVSEIRERYRTGDGSQRSLAAEYGVSHTVIWQIVTRRSWKHVQ